MEKIRKFIIKLFTKWYIKYLSKEIVYFKDDYFGYFLEPGWKSRGRFNVISVVWSVLNLYFINIPCFQSFITGINIKEIDEDVINVEIKTTKPGLLIGKNGGLIDKISSSISNIFHKKTIINLSYSKELYGTSFIENY